MCKISLKELVGRLQPKLHGYNMGGMIKTFVGFGDLALIFKVTAELNRSNLSQIELVC